MAENSAGNDYEDVINDHRGDGRFMNNGGEGFNNSNGNASATAAAIQNKQRSYSLKRTVSGVPTGGKKENKGTGGRKM